MARCDTCSALIFGGKKVDGRRYCNARCRDRGEAARVALAVDPEILDELLVALFDGDCPRCGGPGPVDVSVTHKAYSLFVVSWWKSDEVVACRRCGRRSQTAALIQTAVLGWWSWSGIFITPVMMVRSVRGLSKSFDPEVPSEALEKHLTLKAAVESRRRQQDAS